MRSGFKTALVLPLYPVLFLVGAFKLPLFVASVAGWTAFIVLYVALRDIELLATGPTLPIVAYLGGLGASAATALAAHWASKFFPTRVRAPAASPGRILLEVRPLALAAAKAVLDVELAKLSEREAVVLGSHLSDAWAVFDWYVPGRREEDARVVVRAAVDLKTRYVTVQSQPQPEPRARVNCGAITFALIAPVPAAAIFVLLSALTLRWQFDAWPSWHHLRELIIWSWAPWQAGVLMLLYQRFSAIAVKLPDGEVLLVNRVRLKGRPERT